MGLSLLVSAWLFFRATGGLFNPNISFALLLTGIITPARFVLYAIAQLLGDIVAAVLVLALLPGKLASKCVFPHIPNFSLPMPIVASALAH
jgi:aquaporin rerated protein, other eukaryote